MDTDLEFKEVLDFIKKMTGLSKAKIVRDVFYFFTRGNISTLFNILEEMNPKKINAKDNKERSN